MSEESPPKRIAPSGETRGKKLGRAKTRRFLAARMSRSERVVKRLLAEHRRLATVEAFLEGSFWAVQSRRCRLADELARNGVSPFNQPSGSDVPLSQGGEGIVSDRREEWARPKRKADAAKAQYPSGQERVFPDVESYNPGKEAP
jgi:hypothetical protein